ncbi:MAG: hypothetical protein IE914_03095 [Thiotrichales bacterium]|nr:hypothetical protein [Thiotrichales bacterium]
MSNPNEDVKKKQKLFLYVLVAFILGLAFLVIFMKDNASPESNTATENAKSPEIVTERYSGIGSAIDERELWMAESSNKIEQLEKQNKEQKNSFDKALQQMKAEIEQKIRDEMQGNKQAIQKELDEAKAKNAETAVPAQTVATKPQKTTQPFVTGGEANHHNTGLQITNRYYANPNAGDIGAYKGEDLIKKEPEMVSFSFPAQSEGTGQAQNASDAPVNPNTIQSAPAPGEPVKKADSYIPAGSFVRAILIGGLDAPTGGQAQSNPHPVLMKLDDLAQLPNDLKYDIKNCHLIGASYGDISSERAIIRLETLSCIDQDDVVHEATVKGFVFGEDGKAGVRGRVITKQGQLLVNSLIAGIGAGIGQAFQQQSMTYSTSALGSVGTIDPEKIGVAGVGTGVGKALDRLSQYYISLAEKMFPVIEVDAGRSVDVVLTSGFSFDNAPIQQDGEIDYLAGIDSLTAKGKNVIKQVQGMTGVN